MQKASRPPLVMHACIQRFDIRYAYIYVYGTSLPSIQDRTFFQI
jgi:hypothetical protein